MRHLGAERVSFSAMRVCQPGPEARQRSMTSSVSRIEIRSFGFAERGRPPFFNSPLASISSVSSGSSSYSSGRILCFATLVRFDPKARRDTLLLSVICLSHAEYVTVLTPRGVADYNHSILKESEADIAAFTVVLTQILYLEMRGLEYETGVLEIKASSAERFFTLGRIVGYLH